MEYLGMSELQPWYDGRKSFYGKASVERYATSGGTKLVLKSYGTLVAAVSPVGKTDDCTEVYYVEVAMKYLSATTVRHVKEFLAQTDSALKGITLPWLRKAVKDGRRINGSRKVYVFNEM